MKYLVNRKTKEHVTYNGSRKHGEKAVENGDYSLFVIEADSEGWIPHTGNECPLPDDVLCDTKWVDGQDDLRTAVRTAAGVWEWADPSITHYRPILEESENVQEPEPVVKDFLTTDLLDKLKAAHEAGQQIPDLEAELREVLGSMGYDLVARSPFVETEAQGTDAAVKDALIYGTSVMRGGKHTPIQDFYVAPEAAQERHGAQGE